MTITWVNDDDNVGQHDSNGGREQAIADLLKRLQVSPYHPTRTVTYHPTRTVAYHPTRTATHSSIPALVLTR